MDGLLVIPHLDSNGRDLAIEHVQDVEPILAWNREARRDEQHGDWARHVARIPNVIYVKWLDEEPEQLARQLEDRFPAWGRLPQVFSRHPYSAVVFVALHPGILAEPEMGAAEKRDFARCYARYPDQVIEGLGFVRRLAIFVNVVELDQRGGICLAYPQRKFDR